MYSVVLMLAMNCDSSLAVAQAPAPEPAPPPKRLTEMQSAFPDRAVLIIHMPPDGELYFNYHYVRSCSDRRTFVTPPLCAGHSYYYDLKVHVVRDGRRWAKFERVTFRPGQVVEVSFG